MNSYNIFSIHFNNPVSGKDTRFFRWSSMNRKNYNNRVNFNTKLHSDSFKISQQNIIRILKLRSRNIHGMWVQAFKHAVDGRFFQFITVHTIHIIFLNIVDHVIHLVVFVKIYKHPIMLPLWCIDEPYPDQDACDYSKCKVNG